MQDEIEIPDEPVRLPGLYRAWEIGCLIRCGRRYNVEGAGTTCDGAPLFAVYAMTDEVTTAGDTR